MSAEFRHEGNPDSAGGDEKRWWPERYDELSDKLTTSYVVLTTNAQSPSTNRHVELTGVVGGPLFGVFFIFILSDQTSHSSDMI